MDLKLAAVLAVGAIMAVAAAVEAVVKLATNMSLLQKLVGQHRNKVLAGILCLICFAGGTLFGEYALSSKTKGEIEKANSDYQANRAWALRVEEEKNFLLQALNQAPVLQREYDTQCERQQVPCIFLYSAVGFGGRWLALPISDYADLRLLGFNDAARSIKIRGAVHAIAYVDVDYHGNPLPINGNIASLDKDFREFTQAISSVHVYKGRR